jgi:arylsulfatase A
MTWEGGVRVPCIMRMPGRIPRGRVTSSVASTLDLMPTIARLAGAEMPRKPLDGIDLWPLLSGKTANLERPEVLLYFDEHFLLCARWKQWKLHVARFNHAMYSAAPAEGRKVYALVKPELYDLSIDADESYDVAAEHPEVVREIEKRIEGLMPGFPEDIVQRWKEQRARRAAPVPAGAIPRAAAAP